MTAPRPQRGPSAGCSQGPGVRVGSSCVGVGADVGSDVAGSAALWTWGHLVPIGSDAKTLLWNQRVSQTPALSKQPPVCLRPAMAPGPRRPPVHGGPTLQERCARCACQPVAGEGEGWCRSWRPVRGSLVLLMACGHTGHIQVPSRCFSASQAPGGGDGPRVTGPPAIHAHSSRGFS